MRTSLLAVAACAALGWCGCRTDPAIALLERDNRLKDDEIWRLRGQIEDMEERLAAVPMPATPAKRGPLAPIRDEGPRLAPASGSPPPSKPLTLTPPVHSVTPPATNDRPPTAKPPKISPLAPGTGPLAPGTGPSIESKTPAEKPTEAQPPADMKPPVIVLPPEALPEGQVPERLKVPENLKMPSAPSGPTIPPGPPGQGGSSGRKRPSDKVATAATTPVFDASSRVAQITLNHSLTGSYNPEGGAATGGGNDQGLLVVIEPREALGQPIDAVGHISVVVLDPAYQGDAARVARWEVSPDEAASMLRSGTDRGIHLQLAWPEKPPGHSQLQLFVRYTTRDGRRLQTSRPIEVAVAGGRPNGWIPLAEGPLMEPKNGGSSGWQQAANPTAPSTDEARAVEGLTPRMATRQDDVAPRRPVWSPQRR